MPSKRKAPAAPAAASKSDPELDLINSLAEILNRTGLSEIELDRRGTRLRVSKQVTVTAMAAPAVHHQGPVATAAPAMIDGAHPVNKALEWNSGIDR